jgi:hypothetical protein
MTYGDAIYILNQYGAVHNCDSLIAAAERMEENVALLTPQQIEAYNIVVDNIYFEVSGS